MTELGSRFGEVVRARLGIGPTRGTLATQRLALLANLRRPEQRPRVSMLRVAFAIAALAGASVMLLFWARPELLRPSLHATWAGQTIYDHAAFEARVPEAQALDFSDGSRVLLEPRTRAELGRVTSKLADLRLDSGHLRASIRKHTGVTWTISAGPYRVRVVGTQFSVDWDRERSLFRVEVSEGRVHVSGGDLPANGVFLDAGTHIERGVVLAAAQAATPVPIVAQAATPVPIVAQERAPVTPADLRPASVESSRAKAAPPAFAPAAEALDWQALAKRGRYQAALARAERQGFERTISDLSANDLLLLANAARYAGNHPRARQAQLKLRERFPGHSAAALSAFYLARSSLDIEGRPGDAARWFRVYLSEAPSGGLAAGARSNLMSILLSMGDSAGARAVARDYVRYHPDGPNAKQARALLSEPVP
jgi:TolA-binding protein